MAMEHNDSLGPGSYGSALGLGMDSTQTKNGQTRKSGPVSGRQGNGCSEGDVQLIPNGEDEGGPHLEQVGWENPVFKEREREREREIVRGDTPRVTWLLTS